jgi:hypothetical protein
MTDNEHYYPEDFDQLERLLSYMNSEDIQSSQAQDFKMFIEQFDKRRNLNFSEVFPELKSMLE